MEKKYSERQTDGVNVKNGTQMETLSIVESDQSVKLPYPKRVFFIIGNEFCERFNYNGMRTILALYMKNKLDFSEDSATVLYHTFIMLIYFLPIIGGIISDVWLGKFKTILYLSIVYLIGSVVISIGAIPILSFSPTISLWMGLLLISIGNGGIKPCVSTFGGDQFKLPEQAAQLATYYSLFYFSITLGCLISTSIIPILRKDVHCFGEEDCYSLAFGVPAILMLVAIVLFLIGKSSYTYQKISSENMLTKIFKCIKNAIMTKIREGKTKPRFPNLLDYSIDEYGTELVNDIRILSKILILYLPITFFWALYDQQGSRWTFQAEKMNGDFGFYTIKPDQMHMINSLLVLVFIPLFDSMIYPQLRKIGIERPLQKITIGGIFLGIAFFLSALVQLRIEAFPNQSISMLWQIPQYVIITVSEVFFAITGLTFSYEQAPKRMKSIVMSFWYLTLSFGNFVFIFVAKVSAFQTQSHEFLLFTGLMFVDVAIFMYLAYNYKNSTSAETNSEFKKSEVIKN